jgi:hypothetical protein
MRRDSFAGHNSERFDDPLAGRPERFRARFADFGGPVPDYLAALERDRQLHTAGRSNGSPSTAGTRAGWH